MAQIAFLGGTGPEGLGLALRFALAGESVVIGSRQLDRAAQAADRVRTRLAAQATPAVIEATLNDAAADQASVVALTLPFSAVEPLLTGIAPLLAGKIVLDVVNPVRLQAGVFHLTDIPFGSAAEHIQRLVPQARVVSAFKNLSATELWTMEPLHGDVLLCGDAPDAIRYVRALVSRIPYLRPVNAGSLGTARHLESITALLLNLNRRYHTTTSIRILGLDR